MKLSRNVASSHSHKQHQSNQNQTDTGERSTQERIFFVVRHVYPSRISSNAVQYPLQRTWIILWPQICGSTAEVVESRPPAPYYAADRAGSTSSPSLPASHNIPTQRDLRKPAPSPMDNTRPTSSATPANQTCSDVCCLHDRGLLAKCEHPTVISKEASPLAIEWMPAAPMPPHAGFCPYKPPHS